MSVLKIIITILMTEVLTGAINNLIQRTDIATDAHLF